MAAKQPLLFTDAAEHSQDMPMEIGPWGLSGEPMFPARHVVWASLALVVLTLGILAFA